MLEPSNSLKPMPAAPGPRPATGEPDSSGPEDTIAQFWSEILAPKFVRYRRILVDSAEPHGQHALANHGPASGERILDVGCGFGETTIELGRMVAGAATGHGHALGIDVCDAFLDVARRDSVRAGTPGVQFRCADAQRAPLGGDHDLWFSRFGTMFFANPMAALGNLRSALKPGGRFVMTVWRRIEDNPWLGLARDIARRHLPRPDDDAPSCGPGPFSMADADALRALLAGAGYRDVQLERVDRRVYIGRDLDEATAFQLALGPAGQIVREAGALGERRRPIIERSLREELAPLATPSGVFAGSSSWCVTGRVS